MVMVAVLANGFRLTCSVTWKTFSYAFKSTVDSVSNFNFVCRPHWSLCPVLLLAKAFDQLVEPVSLFEGIQNL